jgi:3',5'-cyclic AMP phosphodiesterase CpdA
LLADLHIDADPAWGRYGGEPARQLRKIVAEVREARVDAVVVAGDCASRSGEPGDYERLEEILAPLAEAGIPVLAVPGNHDDRERMRERFPRRILETGAVTWLLADTCRGAGEVSGEFRDGERAWVESRLTGRGPVILVGHHHPEDPGRGDVEPGIGLVETPRFLAWLDGCPGLAAYVHGHSHAWRLGRTDGGKALVNLPSTAFAFRPGQPLGWVRAEVGEASVRCTLRGLEGRQAGEGSRWEISWGRQ